MQTIKVDDIGGLLTFIDRDSEVLMVIKNSNNKYLFVRKSFYPLNVFRFPGGGIESGESPEVALKREVREEFNQTMDIIANIGKNEVRYFDNKNNKITFTSYCFLLFPTEEIKLENDKEHQEHKWVDIDGIEKSILEMKNISKNSELQLDDKMRSWIDFRLLAMEFVYKKLISMELD